MAALTHWGSEFLLNTTTTLRQYSPTLTALPDGTFVAVWTDNSGTPPDTFFSAIRAQIFNADGTKKGGEFLVNETVAGSQIRPVVTALADGGFVVAWQDQSGEDGEIGLGIRARIFDGNGHPAGDDFRVNTGSAGHQSEPSITALSNGGFVVSYTDESGSDGSQMGVRAQAFAADGTKSGGEIFVNKTTAHHQHLSSVAGLAGGRYVVVYHDQSRSPDDPDVYAIRGRIFEADGTPVAGTDEFLVPTSLAGGQVDAVVRTLSDGRFVVVWTHEDILTGDGSSSSIRAQIFTAGGQKSGSEIAVNQVTDRAQLFPTVVALPDGGFAVAFTDRSTGNDNIRITRFDEKGARIGEEFVANETLEGSQTVAALTLLADGRIVVSWGDVLDTRPDDPAGVFARILDTRDTGVEWSGQNGSEQFGGTHLADTLYGGEGADRLYGAGGDDILEGGAGADWLDGGDGQDTWRPTLSLDFDSVVIDLLDQNRNAGFAEGDYLINIERFELSEGNDSFTAEGFAVTVFGFAGQDTLTGSVEGDYLDGGDGADVLEGGEGDDIYVVDAADTVIELANSGIDTIRTAGSYVLGDHLENLTGLGHGSIRLTGNDLDNVIRGNAGNNTIDGGRGADTLDGGAGDDTYYVRETTDHVVETAGNGTDKIITSISFALTNAQFVEVLEAAAGTASLALTGNAFANSLYGNDGANVLDGGGGGDLMAGGRGDDTYYVDSADDRIIEQADGGVDHVITTVSQNLWDDVENLTAAGSAAISLSGNNLNNRITGNAASNSLDGRGGADTMDGGMGDDSYIVDHVGDQVIEATGGGTDTVLTSVSFKLAATSEIELLTAAAGRANLALTGNSFANTITGNSGANKIHGGLGNDVLRGGAGKDVFVFDTKPHKSSNVDRIMDFKSKDDGIYLENKFFTKLGKGSPSKPKKFDKDMFVEGRKAQDREDRIVYDKKTGSLYYDQDGSGSKAQVKIATISNKTKLYFHDFFVI